MVQVAGQGLALVDTNLFSEEIRTGRLVKPFDVTLDHGYGYPTVFAIVSTLHVVGYSIILLTVRRVEPLLVEGAL